MEELIFVLKETNAILSSSAFDWLSFASFLISIVAVVAAVGIPLYIAKRQDSIALFEKRYYAYSNLLKLKALANNLKDEEHAFDVIDAQTSGDRLTKQKEWVLFQLEAIFDFVFPMPNTTESIREMISAVSSLEMSINELPFLYSKHLPNKSSDMSREISEIFRCLFPVMENIANNASIPDENLKAFITCTEEFIEKYKDLFEKHLML